MILKNRTPVSQIFLSLVSREVKFIPFAVIEIHQNGGRSIVKFTKLSNSTAAVLTSENPLAPMVEAALTNEPDNEELLKLKKDLQTRNKEIRNFLFICGASNFLTHDTFHIDQMISPFGSCMRPGLKFSSVNFSVCGSRKCHDVSSALLRLHYWAPSPSKALGTVAVAAFRKESGATEVIILTTELINANTEKSSSSAGIGASNKDSSSSHSWKIGDRCLAPWSEDGQYYGAVSDDITDSG
ncbi:UNVERIFIED_CONTAM: hypothetical protein NCL1_51497 [Trichonephila clavipes]